MLIANRVLFHIVFGLALSFQISSTQAGGIEHASATGTTQAAACDAAMTKASPLGGSLNNEITGKNCKCQTNPPGYEGDKNIWACAATVKWEAKPVTN